MKSFMQMLKPLIVLLYNKVVFNTDEQIVKTDVDANEYRRTDRENVVAMVANALSTYALSDSTITVLGDNARAELLRGVADKHFISLKGVLSDALGVGCVVSIPRTYTVGDRQKICIDTVSKDRIFLTDVAGDEILGCTVAADMREVNNRTYIRLTDYSIENGVYVIRSRALVDGAEAPLTVQRDWADIQPEMRISGVDRLPVAFLHSPTSNKVATTFEGMPITFGCEHTIDKIAKTLDQIEKEFAAKEVRIFAEEDLFGKNDKLTNVYKVQGRDEKSFFEIYSPEVRSSAFYEKLMNHFAMLEREIGCSPGVLTELTTSSATATEIRAKMYKTFALCTDIQKAVESYYKDLMYACDVLANTYSLSPAGEYDVKFDWSYGLLEDAQTTYQQLRDGVTDGVISKAELRQYIMDEDLTEAEEAIARIREDDPTLVDMLGRVSANASDTVGQPVEPDEAEEADEADEAEENDEEKKMINEQ